MKRVREAVVSGMVSWFCAAQLLCAASPVEMTWPSLSVEAQVRASEHRASSLPGFFLLSGIRFFQKRISHLDGPGCALVASCSSYCAACRRRNGLVVGYLRTCDRLMRCHGNAVGYLGQAGRYQDPVP